MKYIFTVIFFTFFSNLSMSQDIYIFGKMQRTDIDKTKLLVEVINSTYNYTKLNFFFSNSKKPYSYKKKKESDRSKLDVSLNEYLLYMISKSNTQINEINNVKKKIGDNKSKILLTYDRLSTYTSQYTYNDFDKLVTFIQDPKNKKFKFAYLFIYNKEKPKVEIISPLSGQTYERFISGMVYGKEPVQIVQIKTNDGNWQNTNVSTNWTFPLIENNINHIEVRAIDNLFDTSEILKINDIRKRQISIPALSYRYPNITSNVVPKCKNLDGDAASYSFGISVDKLVDINDFTLIIENAKHETILRKGLSTLNKGSSLIEKISKENNLYCIYLGWTFTGAMNTCDINEKNNYYYYFVYTGNDVNVKSTEKLLVHFNSFDPNDPKDRYACNCDQ